MGTLLENEEDLRFSEHMVKTLNTILLTTSELFSLRTSLKELNTEVSRRCRRRRRKEAAKEVCVDDDNNDINASSDDDDDDDDDVNSAKNVSAATRTICLSV